MKKFEFNITSLLGIRRKITEYVENNVQIYNQFYITLIET